MLRPYTLLLVLVALLVIVLFLFRIFLGHAQDLDCIPVNDPFHARLRPINFSAFIFVLTYVPVLLFVGIHSKEVKKLEVFTLAYVLIVLTRMLGIYLLPLCEPAQAIPLYDPLLGISVYPGGYSAIDLMYSGHTATLFLVYLSWGRAWKQVWLWCTLAVGIMLVWQKVHYMVDVLVALPVCWACYTVAKWILNRKRQ